MMETTAQAEANAGGRKPQAIVILSDGTGNSAAKLLKTNVWRLYQALEFAEPTPEAAADGVVRQIAYYDNGVGTSSFKPLAILGGVFGLKRVYPRGTTRRARKSVSFKSVSPI